MHIIRPHITIPREWRKRRAYIPELGERHTVCDWIQPEDGSGPWVDEARFGELLTLLPDKIVGNLLKAKDAQVGRIPLLKAGLGYEECLSAIIVDGSTIASSSTESLIVPSNVLPANYLQPGGIPGRTIVIRARGRITTLTTGATLTVRWGSKVTAPGATSPALSPTWCVSGAIAMDATAQTATQWRLDCGATTRSVGASGTVFAMGDFTSAAQALTVAASTASFLGSAGSATPAAVTVDMTVPQFTGLATTWSLTTAYSITCHRYVLEALN